MNKHLPKILFITLYSNLSFAEQLLNQDVDISFGSTLSNSGLSVGQLTGGPYTIDNAGTIESTNGNTIRMDVDTTLNNSGLIDADMTNNGQAIQFYQNSGNNSLTNSGTIRVESTGAFSPAIKVQASTVSSITNTATGTIQSSGATTVAQGIRVDGVGSSINLITNEGSITATGPGGANGIGVLANTAASINQINNSGSITAQGGTGVTHGIVFWDGSGTTVTNSGTIQAQGGSEDSYGISFAGYSGANSLINSGTIQSETTGQLGQAIRVRQASLTEITNSSGGTIKVTDSAYVSGAIRIETGGSVNTITNNGTITATGTTHSRGIMSIDTGTIDRINNTGTIQAQGGSETNYGIVFWNDSGTTVTNSGTIQGTGGTTSRGIHINRNIFSITNTGTITGGTDGIGNDGHITNIVNTGTITGTTGYDINNRGSITNLTNSQNNLTYAGKLPTNYYVKVNSSSSYGKITVSNSQGSMNVGIADDSTLSEGTYEAVIDGVTSSNISDSSGTYISNANHYKYSLTNSSGNQWDLIVNDLTQDAQCAVNSGSSGCTKTSCITSSIEKGMNSINNGFPHMNTYDCDTFGDTGRCFSIGGRSIIINKPKSEVNGLVLVYGKKESSHFRWGAFLHSNVSYHTSANLKLTDKTPLLGFYGVWNENDDHTGLQFKIGSSYQATNAVITRPVVGVSDQATGNTSLYNNQVIFELRNNKKISDNFILSPYIATIYSQKKQKGYTETGISLPITYNKIIDTSITAITGIKFKKEISFKNTFYGSIGIEHDISHNLSTLSPTGVSGLTTVDLTQNHRATRPVISLGLDHKISENQILRIKGQYQELPYGQMNETNLYISYNYMF